MPDYEKITDEALIRRLRDGENDIMEYLLEKYKPLVRKNCNALYLIGGETEDLIQEGMIGLFKAIRDYDEKQETAFPTFAYLCINRQLYKALEASNRKKNQPLNSYVSLWEENEEDGTILAEALMAEEPSNPEKLILEQEKIADFRQSLQKKLSIMEQRVLTLYLEGNNYIQIAEQMDKAPKSIDNALQRIRSKVRTILEENRRNG